MRQSFEEFLKNKYEHYRKGKKLVLYFDAWMSDLGIAGISQYAEEWSSQQPEGEIYDSLNKLAMDMKNASSGPCGQDSLTLGKRSNTKMWLKKILIIITRFEAILAKRKESSK